MALLRASGRLRFYIYAFAVVGIGFNLLDWLTTWWEITHAHAVESVPLSRWIIANLGWTGFFFAKLSVVPLLCGVGPIVAVRTRRAIDDIREMAGRPRLGPCSKGEQQIAQTILLGMVAVLSFFPPAHNLGWVDASWLLILCGA